ncbi:hypothetical protein A5707_16125 [Mycobacterium kyorinense]|uniref:Integral membrane protein n=1 Tax=Mycobacterium kyorinense TaxID=487514 RepID=A0A1A2ZGS0_9MYCO|nr:hypothetical protein A5707_16125 [Mycobacterium kyorinense]
MAAWTIAAYLLYLALFVLGLFEAFFAAFFAMATDGCHDAACDASYHVWPAMLTMWIGVAVVLALTAVAMFVGTARRKIVVGWPLVGALGLGMVYVLALKVLH